MKRDGKKILVIRRDNIGDLLCTTPLLRALREKYPDAQLDVLVNTYNAPILARNPDVDRVLVYEKAKHRDPSQPFWRWLLSRLGVMRALRSQVFDFVILATPGAPGGALKFARMARARQTIGYGLPADFPGAVALPLDSVAGHECEAVFRLLKVLGIEGKPPAMCLSPDADVAAEMLAHHAPAVPVQGQRLALHISARKPKQRWSVERFAELARQLLNSGVGEIFVFWAPGDENDPLHPGDDRKAATLAAALVGLPVRFVRTTRLEELIAGLSLCGRVICADGGAMHIAAALGKPVVCLFGNSDAARWYPWGVPFELLQKPSRDVSDIAVAEVLAAWSQLAAKHPEGS